MPIWLVVDMEKLQEVSTVPCASHDFWQADCYFCSQTLDEIVITVQNPSPNPSISYIGITDLYGSGSNGDNNGCEVGCGANWSFAGGSGGGLNYDQIINHLSGKADCTFKGLVSVGVNDINYHNMITQLFADFG